MPLILTLALALTLPQGDATASRPSGPEAARRILEAASRAQVPDGAVPKITDFQADFEVSYFDENPNGGSPITRSAHVTEFWKRGRRSSLYRRILVEEGGKASTLAQGRAGPWMKNEKGEVIDLKERGFDKDRQQLKDEISRVERLVDSFFVARLLEGEVKLALTRQDVVVKLESGTVKADEIQVLRAKEDPLRLLVARGTHYVVGVRIRPGTKEEDSLRFDYHQLSVSRSRKGDSFRCLVPTRIEFYDGERLAFSASARDASKLKFNTGIKNRVFQP